MDSKQFHELMRVLDSINTKIIKNDTVDNNSVIIETFRSYFYNKLKFKPSWGRSEIERIFDESIECLKIVDLI